MQSIAPMLAFGHQSRVGKDTCVNAVVDHLRVLLRDFVPGRRFHSVEKRSFFSAGKDSAYEIFKCYGLQPWQFYDLEKNQHLRDEPLEGCGLTPMQIWLKYGAMVREIHEPAFADRAVFSLPQSEFSVFTSLRYPTEVEAVRRKGGWCVKVERVPAPPLRALDKAIPPDFKWDAVIVNDGTLHDLREKARAVLRNYLEYLNGSSAVV